MTFGKLKVRGRKTHPTMLRFAFDLKGNKLSRVIDHLIAFCFFYIEKKLKEKVKL